MPGGYKRSASLSTTAPIGPESIAPTPPTTPAGPLLVPMKSATCRKAVSVSFRQPPTDLIADKQRYYHECKFAGTVARLIQPNQKVKHS